MVIKHLDSGHEDYHNGHFHTPDHKTGDHQLFLLKKEEISQDRV